MPLPDFEQQNDRNLFPYRQPGAMTGETGAKDFQNSQTEHNFRSKVPKAAAIVAAVKKAASPPSAFQQPNPILPSPPPVIDRWHKGAASPYGAYLTVTPPDNPSNTDQNPPANASYFTTITAAYDRAKTLVANFVDPNARVAILITPAVYNEAPLSIDTPQIDIIGFGGRPTINSQITILPSSDMRIMNCRLVNTGVPSNGALWLPQGGIDLDPKIIPNAFYDCEFYGGNIGMLAERRFYAENCDWYVTDAATIGDELKFYALRINYQGLTLPCPIKIVGGSINAYLIQQQQSAGINFGYYPWDYALYVTCLDGGPYVLPGLDDNLYSWPHTHVVLEDVSVNGSLYCDSARVQHVDCRVHGGKPFAVVAGTIYATCVSRRINAGDGTEIGYNPAHVIFDNTPIYAQCIAEAISNGDTGEHVGMSYVQVNNSPHKSRWDVISPFPFHANGGNGTADVGGSPSGAADWHAGGWTVNTDGFSAINSRSCRDFYLM